jgi:hypothetical protein
MNMDSNADNWGVIIRNNAFVGPFGENAIDLKGSQFIWVDGNIMTGAYGDNDGPIDGNDRGGGGTVMRGSNAVALNWAVRSNIIYNSTGAAIHFPSSKNSVAGHNTLLGNNRDFSGPDNSNPSSTSATTTKYSGFTAYGGPNTIVNNIIGGHVMGDVAIHELARFHLNKNFM